MLECSGKRTEETNSRERNTMKSACSFPLSSLPIALLAWSFIAILPPLAGEAGAANRPDSELSFHLYTGDPAFVSTLLPSGAARDTSGHREKRCLQAGKWLGVAGGSFMGLAHIYWSVTGVSGIHGPLWKNLVTGLPSAAIGAFVGAGTTRWATRRIMEGNPAPFKAALKGAAYGAVDGAIVLTAGILPLLLTGHFLETISFNTSEDMIVLKILGASILGGALYGGTFGAGVGLVYGPCISFYLNFAIG